MKKIIGGKRYDTDTATEIAVWEPYYNYRDFNYIKEVLYRKKTGEYFLHGEGGPLTKYRESVGDSNTWGYGEKIIPLSIEMAKKWAEKVMNADEYEKEFEIAEEDNILFSVLLPETLYAELKAEAEEKGVSMKEIVVDRLK